MNTLFDPSEKLHTASVEQYRGEGYLIYREPVFPPSKFDALKNCFENVLAQLDAEIRPESMDVLHFGHPELFQWLFADEILDLVEPIVGPDIALFSSHFICKPKGNGKRVPWHEDSTYWKTMLDPMEVVTVWLALDPSRVENGCMKVIPRSHNTGRKGFSDYEDVDPSRNVFSVEITKPQRDDSRAVAIELEPNQCSLHDGRIIHGSDPNTSTMRRCGYTMRYMSAGVRFNDEKHGDWHQIYLARGRDRCGNRYADPAQAYDELARFRAKQGRNGH